MKTEQKVQVLANIRGQITPEEGVTVASWLKKADGMLFLSIAFAMEPCGAGVEALTCARSMISNAQSPVSQWGPAMDFIEWVWVRSPFDHQARESLAAGHSSLLGRLRHPLGDEHLYAVLTARDMVWHDGNVWILDDTVLQDLSALLESQTLSIRLQAALMLAKASNEDEISSRACIGLVKVLVESSPPVPVPIHEFLRTVLGVGPVSKDSEAIKAFWEDWLRREGMGLSLTLYALERAKSSAGMSLGNKSLLARQIVTSSHELPREECPKVWAALRKVFEEDKSPSRDRCAAWLYALLLMASREHCKSIQGEALSMLLKMTQEKDGVLRQWAVGQIGNLPGSTERASPSREILEEALKDPKESPEDRAMAAWSLRKAAKGNRQLVEQMVTTAEVFQGLPSAQFKTETRTRCIGLVCGALGEATGKDLSLDPRGWRKELADCMPERK